MAQTSSETTGGESAALESMRYTLFVVGSSGSDGAHFMVANWGTQASFEPRRFVAAIKRSARTLENIRSTSTFTVNYLDDSRKAAVKEILKAQGNGLPTKKGSTPAPRFDGAFAGIDCEVVDVVDTGGDHMLVVGNVVGGWKEGDAQAITLRDVGMSYAG